MSLKQNMLHSHCPFEFAELIVYLTLLLSIICRCARVRSIGVTLKNWFRKSRSSSLFCKPLWNCSFCIFLQGSGSLVINDKFRRNTWKCTAITCLQHFLQMRTSNVLWNRICYIPTVHVDLLNVKRPTAYKLARPPRKKQESSETKGKQLYGKENIFQNIVQNLNCRFA